MFPVWQVMQQNRSVTPAMFGRRAAAAHRILPFNFPTLLWTSSIYIIHTSYIQQKNESTFLWHIHYLCRYSNNIIHAMKGSKNLYIIWTSVDRQFTKFTYRTRKCVKFYKRFKFTYTFLNRHILAKFKIVGTAIKLARNLNSVSG